MSKLLPGMTLAFLLFVSCFGQPPSSLTLSASEARNRLAPFNALIGEWRGVAQPKRGSNSGAWFETASWRWDFPKEGPEIHGVIDKGKLIRKIRLQAEDDSRFKLSLEMIDDTSVKLVGRWQDKKLIAEEIVNPGVTDAERLRCTLSLLAENRVVLLVERQRTPQARFARVVGVGYTRKGASLAVRKSSGRECIVTGGAGTIPVTYQGKTWYVCCTGCRQVFEDDPEGTIADFRERDAQAK